MLVTKHKASGDLQHQTEVWLSLFLGVEWWFGGQFGSGPLGAVEVLAALREKVSVLCATVHNWSLAVSIASWWCKLILSNHFSLRQWACCHFPEEACSWSGCLGERVERLWAWLNARGITAPANVRKRRPVETLCSVHKQRIHLLETDLLNTFSSGIAATNGSLWSLRRVGSWSYKGDCRWPIRICTDKYFL